jgi:hypothetical protein
VRAGLALPDFSKQSSNANLQYCRDVKDKIIKENLIHHKIVIFTQEQ